MIVIHSNGSKWRGEELDSIEKLLNVLEEYALDPSFEDYGNFIFDADRVVVRFWGNFYELSHVFSIDTDEDALITRLTTAIRANQRREPYQKARKTWLQFKHGDILAKKLSKNMKDSFYEQFADPHRAYSNLPSLIRAYFSEKLSLETSSDTDFVEYARLAVIDYKNEKEQ